MLDGKFAEGDRTAGSLKGGRVELGKADSEDCIGRCRHLVAPFDRF